MPCSLFSDLSIHKCILLMIQKNISTAVREETSALVAPSIYTLTWRPDLLPCSWSGKYTQVPVCVSIYPTLLLRAKRKGKMTEETRKKDYLLCFSSLFISSIPPPEGKMSPRCVGNCAQLPVWITLLLIQPHSHFHRFISPKINRKQHLWLQVRPICSTCNV